MLKNIQDNIFNLKADILINPVNCVGVMGKGLALEFKNKYPKMFNDYKKICDNKKLSPGKLHIWKNNNIIIINFPTKEHWKDKSTYRYIEYGLIKLKDFLQKNENKTVAIPKLGCGLGGLSWVVVKELFYVYLNDLNHNIIIVEK